MNNLLLLSLLPALGLATPRQATKAPRVAPVPRAQVPARGQRPADKIFTYPPPAAARLVPAVSQRALAQYLGTVPASIRGVAKARNVVFMNDCLTALTGHVRQFSEEGQRTGLSLSQIQDNNAAFIQKVVGSLRDAYDKEEEAEHRHDPKNPRTGKSLREEAEIYTCGLRNYLPLFNNLMAAQPMVTILTQPSAANVFMVLPEGYRRLGLSELSKPLRAGVYTLIFTKPGYQSVRRTLAAQHMPVQVFRTTLPLAAK
ncbi:MAG: hypothetical protein EOO59_21180 [Hymenobacter sp.]|nr:MAG: hypothetical protein EOO59_21180 [Hymenobacter sp.]